MSTQDKLDFPDWEKLLVMVNSEERWRQLCAKAAVEQDPQKLMDLVKEISRLLDEKQSRNRVEHETPRQKDGDPPASS
jgi:hypothetical protein